jgi:hypothetical protein
MKGLFPRHPLRNQLLNLLFEVLLNLLGKIAGELTTSDDLPQPHHAL